VGRNYVKEGIMSAKIDPKLLSAFLLLIVASLSAGLVDSQGKSDQQTIQEIKDYREGRDGFFKEHPRSPLDESQRGDFKALTYYPIDLKYRFDGKIERYKYHIMNPKYYANFLTNKGIKKRYIRYGKFRFQLNGKEHTMELYKSPGSDHLFIPFRDKTNGSTTYNGGRYLDAEIIMPGYKIVIDFNMAYNPSCVYNEKYTCIIPPDENNFDVEIRAGEKMFQQP
jgi:uncharacterized protein (DUF1684 family)